jgi:hypothetical protein
MDEKERREGDKGMKVIKERMTESKRLRKKSFPVEFQQTFTLV